jgi:lipid-A-disaccharide synthase
MPASTLYCPVHRCFDAYKLVGMSLLQDHVQLDKKPVTIFLSAGEASGETYGAQLMVELRARLVAGGNAPSFVGMGGGRMEGLGLRRVVRAEDVAVMGITEVIRHLPRIYKEYRKLKASVSGCRPDVAVLIDFPDIHLKLAEEFKRLGIPVIFFVSPQLWAWKKGRIRRVQRFVDRMLVIFPFEEPFYREHGVDARYVGHPLADLPLPSISRERFAEEDGLDPQNRWVGLLPGSRMKEIRLNLPEMVRAAGLLWEREPRTEFLFPLASTLTMTQIHEVTGLLTEIAGCGPECVPIRMVRDARAALHHSVGSIVASGTATVEAALIGNPFVVVYRVSPVTYAIAKRVVTVPHVAMVNLVANWDAAKRLVPELIQDDFTAGRVVQELEPLLVDGDARSEMMAGLADVGMRLRAGRAPGETAIQTVADEVMGILEFIPPTSPDKQRP